MDPELRNDLIKQSDRLKSKFESISSDESELFKARQDFYQHLMFLDAGNSSLTFTIESESVNADESVLQLA